MKSVFYVTLVWALLTCAGARSQDVAVKTNLLYDAFATVNVGAEVGLAPKWTLDVSGNVNAWTLSRGRKWKHWMVQPEARYWLCDRFAGHFFAVHAHGGQYNIGGLKNSFKMLGTDFSGLSASRYQGWFIGAGVGYGYAWVLGRHWNLEGELGIATHTPSTTASSAPDAARKWSATPGITTSAPPRWLLIWFMFSDKSWYR